MQPESNAEAGFRAAIERVNALKPDFVYEFTITGMKTFDLLPGITTLAPRTTGPSSRAPGAP